MTGPGAESCLAPGPVCSDVRLPLAPRRVGGGPSPPGASGGGQAALSASVPVSSSSTSLGW